MPGKMVGAMELFKLWRMWFPAKVNRAKVASRLASFYEQCEEYHAMTSSGDKTLDPQVMLLSSLLLQGGDYAEVGCGGGAVCRLVGDTGNVVGIDYSEIALQRAVQLCAQSKGRVSFIKASADQLPLPDDSFDGAYSFEVMEHVWEPEAMLREMIRIVKPGGFILITAPNHFSLDMHLPKRALVRGVEMMFAVARRIVDAVSRKSFHHVTPDFDHGVYPDCDRITAVVPANMARQMTKMGCDVIFWDTTYMFAHRSGRRSDLRLQRNTGKCFLKHFGDHLLILGRKKLKGQGVVQ